MCWPTRSIVGNALLLAALSAAGCRRDRPKAPEPADELQAALDPSALVARLRKLPGVHFAGTCGLRVARAGGGEDGGESVTTTTDLWIDERGRFRLVENNDRDGGREVVLFGRELAVALRYGKLIRRPAQEPEPTHFLEEAVGAPWAAWETLRRFTVVAKPPGAHPGLYRLSRAATPEAATENEPAHAAPETPLRRWRGGVQVKALAGEAQVDPKTGALFAFAIEAHFFATRDATPIEGRITVRTRLDGVGSTPAIAQPVAEDLRGRQRTILEERALLPAGTRAR